VLIPSKRAALLRKYEGTIFHAEDTSYTDRIQGFYLLLRPVLGWVRDELARLGLEQQEVESELYILSCMIFKHYDKTKSSIIPYLEKHLEWRAGRFIAEAKKRYAPTPAEDYRAHRWHYSIDEEFYWKVPGIILEDRYVGKCFTRAEKYIISKILTADIDELSHHKLAEACSIERRSMRKMLLDLRAQFQLEE